MSDVKPPSLPSLPSLTGPSSGAPPLSSSGTASLLHVTSVLLVDDQPSNLLALEAILEPLGQNLVRANSGKEALKHLLGADFSVILLDVQMPELDGFETASLIKDRAKSRHIPIIFLTAISKEASYVARGYNVGAVDYITKPFEPDALRQKVSVFVDLFRKNETIRQQAEALREHREREFAEIKRASDQRYRQLAESMPQVVWMADAQGELTYGNRRWYAAAAGRPLSELSVGPRWEQVLHPDDLAPFLETFSAAMHRGQDWEAQFRFGSLEPGVHRWHLVRAVATRSAEGRVSSWIGTNTDIDDRKRAEDALRVLADASTLLGESLDYQAHLEEIAARVGAGGAGRAGIADVCTLHVNERNAPLRLAAMAERETGRAEALVTLARDASATRGPQEVLRSGKVERGRLDEPSGGGATGHKSLSYLCIPVRARDRIAGVLTLGYFGTHDLPHDPKETDLLFGEDLARRLAAAVDVSELYALAQRERVNLEQANRVKDEFLATLSHELRTPLNAVLGWTQLLRAGTLDARGTERALETVERNARSQAQLIADLLDVSRIVSGKLKLEMSRVPLRELVDEAVTAAGPAADAKKVALVARLDEASFDVSGDAERLQQITSNLISNAIKFTPAGGTVTVSLARRPGWASLTVTDTGQGITTEFLPFVFDRFRQADSTTTRTQGGLGLGLSIVKHLAELHGGTVRVASDGEGAGAAFTVEIPRVSEERTERSPLLRAEASHGEWARLAGVKVLVVEDDPDGRELLRTVLERCQAEVVSVGNVPAALEAIRAARPDVVVSDIGLPGEDGYALARYLQTSEMRDADGRALPAIALTAYVTERDRAQALSAGFLAHAAKPVDPRELSLTVASVLRGHVSSSKFKAAKPHP